MCEVGSDDWACLAINLTTAISVITFVIKLLVFLVVLLFSISVHEAAHAWVSSKFGDNTARLLGRVSLNPRKHIDPIGTLLIPLVAFLFGLPKGSPGITLIGWGKPTPINPRKWSNYRWGSFFVSIAGVAANLIVVMIGIVMAKILMTAMAIQPGAFLENAPSLVESSGSVMWPNLLALFTGQLIWLNLMLIVFNLLPIPPLDGGSIITGFLPRNFKPFVDFIKRFGFIIILLLIWFVSSKNLIEWFAIPLNGILNSI